MKKSIRLIALLLLIPLLAGIVSCDTAPAELSAQPSADSIAESRPEESGQEESGQEESNPAASSDEQTEEYMPTAIEKDAVLSVVSHGKTFKASPAAGDTVLLTDGLTDDCALTNDGALQMKSGKNGVSLTMEFDEPVENLCEVTVYYLLRDTSFSDIYSLSAYMLADGKEYLMGTVQGESHEKLLLGNVYSLTLSTDGYTGTGIRIVIKGNQSTFAICEVIVRAASGTKARKNDKTPAETNYTNIPDNVNVPHFAYSFVTGLPLHGASEAQVKEYFDNLEAVGIEGLILLNTCGSSGAIISTDGFDKLFAESEKRGFKVYVGLHTEGTGGPLENPQAYLQIARKSAEAMYNQYGKKYPETFYGWYFNYELCNLYYRQNTQACIDLLNGAIDIFNELAPEKPMLLSPFSAGWAGDANDLKTYMPKVLSQVHFRPMDIYCPQDSVGTGLTTVETDESYLSIAKSCCDQSGIHFWVNIENFRSKYEVPGMSGDIPGALSRVTKQMEIASKYAEVITTFTYESYSPEWFGCYTIQTPNDSFHKAYLTYLNTGKCPKEIRPADIDTEINGHTVTIFLPSPTYGIMEMAVKRDGVSNWFGRHYIQSANGMSWLSFYDDNPEDHSYSVIVYDETAEASEEVKFGKEEVIAGEPVDRTKTPVNLALGAKYQAPNATHQNGDAGGELTDGKKGNYSFADPAWAGYANNLFTFIIDLGKVESGIGEIVVGNLIDVPATCYRPSNVQFDYSEDGITYKTIGNITNEPYGDLQLGPETIRMELDYTITARYIKVAVRANQFFFCDEIEVLRYE